MIDPLIRNAVPLAVAKGLMVSSRSGSIGAGARDSHRTNPIISKAPNPIAMRTSFEVQPTSVERIRPHSNETAPTVTKISESGS